MRGDNLPKQIQQRPKGSEVHSDETHHGNSGSEDEKIVESIKKAEFEFMIDPKTLMSKIAIESELNRVQNSMRREDRETAPDRYKPVFDKMSIRWGLVFIDAQIVVPIGLRRLQLDILHFGHSGMTKMEIGANIFCWPEKKNDIDTKVKDCTTCFDSCKISKYHLPKNHKEKLQNLIEPRQEIQIDFKGKLHNKNIHRDVQNQLP